jgi:hypothetical protein
MGIIYLIQVREFIGTDIYKIGRSDKNGCARTSQYPKGSLLIYLLTCNNSRDIEIKIINAFKNKYKHKKEYGHEYFSGDYYHMINDITEICKSSNQLEFDIEPLPESENNNWVLKWSEGLEIRYRSHYVKCTNGDEFMCETSNGFIQKIVDKQILKVDEVFNINDTKLIKKINKQKNNLTIENFDNFCDVFGIQGKYRYGEIEKFFDDTIINNTFYALTKGDFNKLKFFNFENKSYYIPVNEENFKNKYSIYSSFISIHNNYVNIKIISIYGKLYCEELFWIFIPRQIHIDYDKKCYFYSGREHNFIGHTDNYSKYMNEYNFKSDYLYEPGSYPWSSGENYDKYFINLDKFEITNFKCLNPIESLNILYNFKGNNYIF